ncbi:hypothetical protein QLH51_15390 [Sphingomonas sp. 2R-10]|uniref:hypothetical protein n=1 Tax=Sphingomonas sp. 2R-10 TaxID=3045148 RepID=UPI000F79A272|nr:hypothetical protein [Sphingomonas sp. 2R-10]MDJ0278182.1 hypothetical protein [Sphingomonas sp. 2R-10]
MAPTTPIPAPTPTATSAAATAGQGEAERSNAAIVPKADAADRVGATGRGMGIAIIDTGIAATPGAERRGGARGIGGLIGLGKSAG